VTDVEQVEEGGGKPGEVQWGSRWGFILAAVGSAIGLGNVWRFPNIAYEYGGGAFLIPYIIAMFVSGIPLLILEMGVGKTLRTSAPFALIKLDKRYGWVGWMMLLFGFMVMAYYTVIIAWSLFYAGSSLDVAWGADPEGYFYDRVVGITAGPGDLGSLNLGVAFWLIMTWACIYLIIIKGIERVEKVVMITVPLPVILLALLAVRSLSLEGASVGLEYFLTPNMDALADPNVWLAAFAQIFFTLSLATGVMIAYTSRLPKESDVVNNAHLVSYMDVGFSFFAGIVVFATLGYMAVTTGVDITEVAQPGPGLAFIAYPTAISMMGAWGAVFGVLFFVMLFTLGIDSAFATIEAITLAFKDAGHKYAKMAFLVCAASVVLALFFATGGGYHWIWIVDHFVNEIGLVTVGILECFIVGHLYSTQKFMDAVNETSELKVSTWWLYSVRYVTPAVLTIILVAKIVLTALHGYPEDDSYPGWALFLGGIFPVVLIIFLSRYMSGRLRPSP
jgi:NSS family neurotransmitter:Na+ symporter